MMNAYDKIYLEKARSTLGNMLDFAVNALSINITDFWNMFLLSPVSEKFASGDTAVIAGKSGAELAYTVTNNENTNRIISYENYEKTPEYWAGWAVAYYQWKKNYGFSKINGYISIENIRQMYFPYHETDISKFCDRIDEIISSFSRDSNLKALRTKLGLTQKILAEMTGIPIRTIQQYEQKQKSINGARAEYITALSKALYCSPEELLEDE